jgi:anhydro-N-acetylmuramic acid kinase
MPKNKTYTALGLMSGTSLDGVDCALIETDGADFVRPLDFVTCPYDPATREIIRACFGKTNPKDSDVVTAAKLLTQKHADAVLALLGKGGYNHAKIDVIGFHGQTIFHAPKDRITLQIGDGAWLAERTGIDVVDDFRTQDVLAGGEGAPLAPLYHQARACSANLPLPCVILNIGGVANVTWIGERADHLLAFDTGAGNALIDDWVRRKTGKLYDENGRFAAAGVARRDLLAPWYNHPYFARTPPKSLDRDQWDIAALGPLAKDLESLSVEDGAATLSAFSVDMIVESARHMPDKPKAWYACGGGRHNTHMMASLESALQTHGLGQLFNVDSLGWDGDAIEAECFAYLAVRSILQKPISLPGTTNAPTPLTGGVFHQSK